MDLFGKYEKQSDIFACRMYNLGGWDLARGCWIVFCCSYAALSPLHIYGLELNLAMTLGQYWSRGCADARLFSDTDYVSYHET